jgi:3-hydroxyisobutyrate dehydrogenase-like beta-hydroxyacid dehydrogenase
MVRVGYIGLGNIGAPMAARIISPGGFFLTVWNRTPEKMEPLVAAGAKRATSAAEVAAASDIVCLCLDSADAVEKVVFGAEGIVSGGKGRTRLVVDNSTLHPLHTREFAERLRCSAGMGWLDIPVSGGPVGATAGTLAAMAGGDAEELESVRPVIMSYANRLTHMGPIGSGQATKACNQIINFGTIAAIAEAYNVAGHFGLDPERLPEAIAGGFADSNMLREIARARAEGESKSVALLMQSLLDFYDGRINKALAGKLNILMKDVGVALDLARATGAAAPVLGLFDNFFRVLHHQKPETRRA